MQYEVVGCLIHEFSQSIGALNDGFALSPGKCGGPKGHDFTVLRFCKSMWNGDRIVRNEVGSVVPRNGSVQEFFQFRYV
jgi:hypothetical protein